MKLRTELVCRHFAGILTGAIVWVFGSQNVAGSGQPALQTPVPTGNGGIELRVSGTATGPVVVQKSSDLKEWSDVGEVRLIDGTASVTDTTTAESPSRYYRLKILPSDLPDLNSGANTVFMAGEGFDTLQFAPSGKLGFIVWKSGKLIYRERSTDGVWREEQVSGGGAAWAHKDYEDHRFQPPAALLFDSASRPHVIRASGYSERLVCHSRGADGVWSEQAITAPFSGSVPALMAVAMGPNDQLHIALVGSGSSPALQHGTVNGGSWQWSRVATIGGQARGFLPQAYSPRFFSLAVDSKNAAHLVFTPQFRMPSGPGGYMMPASDLAYASNRSGSWKVQTIHGPTDGTGDAGLGASIAIDANDEPAVASWYNERAPTGSAQWSQLLFHRRDSNGEWRSTVAAKSPDGYVAGDGPRGTGFAPYLRFDGRGVPHIVFSDHAAEHFSSGQNEFAGQIRHAWFDGRSWNLGTIYRQSGPLKTQMIYPALAVNGSEIVCMGLERQTQFRSDYRVATSTYRFVFVPTRMR